MPYNRAMPRLDILLPFALPPTELAADLKKALNTPALATLLTRARADAAQVFDEFPRALPHEHWLAQALGHPSQRDNSPPLAAPCMQRYGLQQSEGTWFILHPVHIHIARDHLVLTDPRRLDLTESEAHTLFDIARPMFEEAGKPLLYGDAHHWFVRADDWHDLKTATPDAASGHNVDLWLPRGPGERAWRKLQNEVQMHWFTHPLNDERERRGATAVNSLWLWGGSTIASAGDDAQPLHDARFNLEIAATPAAAPQDILSGTARHALLALDALREPALASDWGSWIAALHELEQHWFAPLLAALRAGTLDDITLIISGESRLQTMRATRASLRKFWLRPTLDRLFA